MASRIWQQTLRELGRTVGMGAQAAAACFTAAGFLKADGIAEAALGTVLSLGIAVLCAAKLGKRKLLGTYEEKDGILFFHSKRSLALCLAGDYVFFSALFFALFKALIPGTEDDLLIPALIAGAAYLTDAVLQNLRRVTEDRWKQTQGTERIPESEYESNTTGGERHG